MDPNDFLKEFKSQVKMVIVISGPPYRPLENEQVCNLAFVRATYRCPPAGEYVFALLKTFTHIWAIERVTLDNATISGVDTVWQMKLVQLRLLLDPHAFGLFNKMCLPSGLRNAIPAEIQANVQYFIGPKLGMLFNCLANVCDQHHCFSSLMEI
jgi:hypothetical protein